MIGITDKISHLQQIGAYLDHSAIFMTIRGAIETRAWFFAF